MNQSLKAVTGPDQSPAYLIVNADDYAYFNCVSRGIVACAEAGTVTATGVFANSPLLDQHSDWLANNARVDAGVHLNLTHGAPLSAGLSKALLRHGGFFPDKFAIATAILKKQVALDLIRDEWRAQIERCLEMNLTLRFLNSHEHIHMLPPLYKLTHELADNYSIEHVRFARPGWPSRWSASALLRDGIMAIVSMIDRLHTRSPAPRFLGMQESGKLSSTFLTNVLRKLRPGEIYELMCHPGAIADGEVTNARVLTYHDWDLERQSLQSALSAAELERLNVRLVRYRDLHFVGTELRVCDEKTDSLAKSPRPRAPS